MKTNKICIIILALILVTAQSCKKDKNTDPVNRSDNQTSFNIYEEKNLDEYLTNFMNKLKNTTRSNELLEADDAMWHLAACLNFQYCNINVQKSQVEYDTIFTSINVNDGCISLNDINTTLQEISAEVGNIYNSCQLKDKNLLYIMPKIQDNTTRGGTTVRTVVAISDRSNFGHYAFDDEEEILELFPEYVTYRWDTDAITTLEYYINMYRNSTEAIPGRVYITMDTTITCYYRNNYIYRLFNTEISDHLFLNREDMAYYLDSYIGLIDECNPGRPLLGYVCSDLQAGHGDLPLDNKKPLTFHHILYITYGIVSYTSNPPTPPLD